MELTNADLQAIRECAYFKWLDAGAPGGDGIDYWLDAEFQYLHDDDRITERTARSNATHRLAARMPVKRTVPSLADEEEMIGTRD